MKESLRLILKERGSREMKESKLVTSVRHRSKRDRHSRLPLAERESAHSEMNVRMRLN